MAEPAPAPAPDLEVIKLTPTIGAEIQGIDLRRTPDAVLAELLRGLLVEHKVIFFREQDLTREQHLAFARCFGDLELFPFSQGPEGYPEILVLENDADRAPFNNHWHSDVTWRLEPSLGSVLYCHESPETGGDTLFADMEAAYENLDDATKQQIDGRYALHDHHPFRRGMRARGVSEDEIEATREKYPVARHPIVRTHPESGRKSLYVNATFTRQIDGMEKTESDELLQRLYRQASIPEHQCRFRWRKHSIAFWDNRSTQHYAAADFFPMRRYMERVTVVGDVPRP
ncbi:MAG: TauD/TfdA family dioxygenase [Gammaproteobacteria bacterium]|nr:TauD/TfdA family dioxygenase [Gammaproteobacteria bacterium]